MIKIPTLLNDCYVIEPKIFKDSRGYFYESFNHKAFTNLIGREVNFVQDNQSKSTSGILRGLHYQTENIQAKLVRVLSGEVFDVAVDLRKSSNTFGQWFGVILSEENKRMLWIPEGFAHGFLVLSSAAEFFYKTSDYYNKSAEQGIKWDDKDLSIKWPKSDGPFLNDKDLNNTSFDKAKKFNF